MEIRKSLPAKALQAVKNKYKLYVIFKPILYDEVPAFKA
jgi:hypothetical protein